MSVQGLVLYCDGGNYRSNNAPGGGGLHGYFYTVGEPDKKNKIKKYKATNLGYIDEGLSSEQITENMSREHFIAAMQSTERYEINITSYLDGFLAAKQFITNNIAEITGMTMAYKLVLEHKPAFTRILCDSQYVVLAVNERLAKWARNGWKRTDGTLIANIEYFRNLHNLIELAKSENLEISVEWVKGHNGNLGNEQADLLAGIAATTSNSFIKGYKQLMDDVGIININESRSIINKDGYTLFVNDPVNYWKQEVEVHPFLQNTRLYWNPAFDHGNGTYYTGYPGNHSGKDKEGVDALLGKKISDSGLSVVKLNVKDDVVNTIKAIQKDWLIRAFGTEDFVVVGWADNMFSTKCNNLIRNYGHHYISSFNPAKPDLFTSDNLQLTTVLYPVYLGQRSLEKLNSLEVILEKYLAGKTEGTVADITNYIYEDNIKVDKKTKQETVDGRRLKPEHGVGLASITVDVDFDLNGIKVSKRLPISLGIDFLKRNNLKHIEDFEPVVNVVTHQYSGEVYEYAVIVTLNNGESGIWAPTHSDRIMVRS